MCDILLQLFRVRIMHMDFVGQNFASDAQGFPRHVVHFRRYLQIDAHKYSHFDQNHQCFPFRFKSNKLMWNGTATETSSKGNS